MDVSNRAKKVVKQTIVSLPHDLDAESQVLGAALKSNSTLEQVIGILPQVNAFYSGKHRRIYEAVFQLHERNGPVDMTTVANQVGDEHLGEIGGRTYLVELLEAVGSTAHAATHARIVADKARLRAIITAGREIVDEASRDGAESSGIIERWDQSLLELSNPSHRSEVMSLADLSDSFAGPVLDGEPAYHRDEYLLTRVNDLNHHIVGFFRGDLTIICAPPSGGKTSFLVDVGLYNAAISGKSVLYIAIDETLRSMVQRLYCASTGIPRWRFADNQWTPDEYEAIEATKNTLLEIGDRFYITDDLNGLGDIRARARRHNRQRGLDLILIDYLQQVEPPTGKRFENRNLEMTEIVRRLKELAKELNVAVVAASQYSRKYEADAQRIKAGHLPRPQLSWLRDSGSIEQEANLVIGMFVPGFILKAALGPEHERTRKELEKNRAGVFDAELVIMKNKMGETGTVSCKFSGPRMQFYSESRLPEPVPDGNDLEREITSP